MAQNLAALLKKTKRKRQINVCSVMIFLNFSLPDVLSQSGYGTAQLNWNI
jgi:hypothetical protein